MRQRVANYVFATKLELMSLYSDEIDSPSSLVAAIARTAINATNKLHSTNAAPRSFRITSAEHRNRYTVSGIIAFVLSCSIFIEKANRGGEPKLAAPVWSFNLSLSRRAAHHCSEGTAHHRISPVKRRGSSRSR